jgi:Holliday junction resolvase RusA-like endonuclease
VAATTLMILTVWGTPVQQGSKNFVGKTKSGRGIMVEQNKERLDPWRGEIIKACRQYQADNPDFVRYEGAVVARLIFCFDRPKSIRPKVRPYMSVAPDLDKLIRACLDGLTAGGAIKDDCQVVDFTRVAKVYCKEDPEALATPGAVIVLAALVPLEQIQGGSPGQGGEGT